MSDVPSGGWFLGIPVTDLLLEIEATFPEPVEVTFFDQTTDPGPI
jgi:hypothetical protein